MTDMFCSVYGCGKPAVEGTDECPIHVTAFSTVGQDVSPMPELEPELAVPPMFKIGQGIGVAIGFAALLLVLSLATLGFALALKLFGVL